jgi:hypothetical protein
MLLPSTTLNFCVQSQNESLQFVRMSKACLVVAGVKVWASGEPATAIGFRSGSGGQKILPSSAFFPWLAATLGVTQLTAHNLKNMRITSVTIPRRVRILCSKCFSSCILLSSFSFERDSELTRIETKAFRAMCLPFVVVPGGVSLVPDDAFPADCKVTTAGEDSNAVFRQWARHRRPGSSAAFERRT